jgi:hypothetical protein
MAGHMRIELVTDALQMALHQRRPAPGLIWHSEPPSLTRQTSKQQSCVCPEQLDTAAILCQ